MIRAIVFDLDNTLLDFMSMKRRAVEAAVDAMIDAGLPLERDEAEREIFAIYDREGIEYQRVFDDLLTRVHRDAVTRSAQLVDVLLGLINAVIRPILILLTLPVTILTLGLFAFVINAFMFAITAWIVPGFDISGFLPALLGSLLLSLANAIISAMEDNIRLGAR